MLKYILFFIMFLVMVGCQSSSKEHRVSDAKKSSLFLAVNGVIAPDVPVAINQKIILNFSASLNEATINNDTVYILDDVSAEPITTTISLLENSSSLEFTPYSYLRANHNYTIVVTTALQDLQGRSLRQEYHFSFKTLNEIINDSPLVLRSMKPETNATGVLRDSKIVMDFSKNLSLEPQYSSDSYFKVMDDVNKQEIAGSTEVFNSLLIFKPFNPLPADTNISVQLLVPPRDIYGEKSYDISQQPKWYFRTQTAGNSIDQNNTGYKILDIYNSSNDAFQIAVLENKTNTSQVVLATTSKLELFNIKYTDNNGKVTKPTAVLLDTYLPSAAVVSMSVQGRDVYVALSDNNISIFHVEDASFDLNASVSTQHPVYKVTITPSKHIFALEPGYGFEVFTRNTSGLLSQEKQIQKSKTIYLDAIEGSYYDNDTQKDITQFYLADYTGGVDTYDENITFIHRSDINGSVKFIVPFESYDSTGSILAINSSGKIQEVDANGSLGNMHSEIVNICYDVHTFHDPSDESFTLMYSLGKEGVYRYKQGYGTSSGATSDNNGFTISKFATSTEIISNEIVTNPLDQGQNFLLTLDRKGFLYISNFTTDLAAPYISYTDPNQGETIDNDANVTLEISDSYLDNASIDEGTFSFYDLNATKNITFTLISNYPGEFILDPSTNLINDHKYRITVDKNISDLLGNTLPKGSEVITFTVTQ